MEILVNLLFFIGEIFLEIILPLFSEVLSEVSLRGITEPFKRNEEINPVLAVMGYILFGALVGLLSLLIPKMFEIPYWMRIMNLVVTPIICGLVMMKIGQIREKRGDRLIRLDTFLYGYLFALAMAVVRFIWR